MRITRWCCYHKVDNFYTNLKNCLLEVGVVGDGGGSTPNSLTLVLGLFLHTVPFREIYEKNKIGLKMNPQFCQLQTRFHKFVSF